MKFYLGAPMPSFLWFDKIHVPLFVSVRRLRRYKKLRKATTEWSLDSGGFTELSTYGKWTVDHIQYIDEIQKIESEIGNLNFISQQDWMCEPFIVAKTGLSVNEHQIRTVDNYIKLKTALPNSKIIPVIQGFHLDEYLECISMYKSNGIDLSKEDIVGLGSVCRRQSEQSILDVVKAIFSYGIKIHGFGVKLKGLTLYKDYLTSSDSMAWCMNAGKNKINLGLPGCEKHKYCNNCINFAKMYYNKVLKIIK